METILVIQHAITQRTVTAVNMSSVQCSSEFDYRKWRYAICSGYCPVLSWCQCLAKAPDRPKVIVRWS